MNTITYTRFVDPLKTPLASAGALYTELRQLFQLKYKKNPEWVLQKLDYGQTFGLTTLAYAIWLGQLDKAVLSNTVVVPYAGKVTWQVQMTEKGVGIRVTIQYIPQIGQPQDKTEVFTLWIKK